MIIEFEGIDKSGKETQSKKTVEWLQSFLDIPVKRFAFPDYTTYSGRVIQQCLANGEPYHPVDNAHEFQIFMTMNRYEKQLQLAHFKQKQGIAVCDRYLTSMMVYGTLSGVNDIWHTGVNFRLLKPDVTIVLDIPIDEYKKRSEADNLDVYEKNLEFLQKVRQRYLDIHTEWPKIIVDGTGTREQVFERVREAIIKHIVEKNIKAHA